MSLGEVEMAVGMVAGLGGIGATAVLVTQAFTHKRPSTRTVIGAVLATAIGAGALYDSPSRVTNDYNASLLPAIVDQLTTTNIPSSQVETMKGWMKNFCDTNKLSCDFKNEPLEARYRAVDQIVNAAAPTNPRVYDNWIEKLQDDHSGLKLYSPLNDHTPAKYTITIREFKGPTIKPSSP